MHEGPTQFLQWQADARKRSRRMYYLYALCLGGTLLGFYVLSLLFLYYGWRLFHVTTSNLMELSFWWHPNVFIWSVTVSGTIIGLLSWLKIRELAEGGRSVAISIGARPMLPITRDNHERKLRNVVEEIAIASGVPMPEIYIMDNDPSINAFAAGYTLDDSVVGVTRGALVYLNRDELQGVIAHEFSHILNGDTRIRTRLIALNYGLMFPVIMSWWPIQTISYYYNVYPVREGCGFIIRLAIFGLSPMWIFFWIFSMMFGLVSSFFGRILQAGVTRERERLADASAVEFTRNPTGLGSALKKIGAYSWKMFLEGTGGLPELDHLFFAAYSRSIWSRLFSTHPPLIQRVRRLDPQFDGQFIRIKLEVLMEPIEDVRKMDREDAMRITTETAPLLVHRPFSLALMSPVEAQEMIEGLPEETSELIQTPLTTIALIYALTLDCSGIIREKQIRFVKAAYGEMIQKQTEKIFPNTMFLSRSQKVTIGALAMPSLRQMSKEQFGIFSNTLTQIIRVDDRVDLFEYCLLKNMERVLSQFFSSSVKRFKMFTTAKFAEDAALILSILARAEYNGENPEEREVVAKNAFEMGASLLKLDGAEIALVSEDQCNVASVDKALDHLTTMSPPYRENLYVGCETVVTTTNGQITEDERDLLRLLAQVLEVYRVD